MVVPESSLFLLRPAVTPEAAHPFGKSHIIIIIFMFHVKVIQNIQGLPLNLAERNVIKLSYFDETQDETLMKAESNWYFQMVSANGILNGDLLNNPFAIRQPLAMSIYKLCSPRAPPLSLSF